MKFDPHASWQPLFDKAQTVDQQNHQNLLNEVGRHMQAEITGQLDPLMATLHSEPVYHFWRVGGENMVLQGYEAVKGFYANMFEMKGQQFQVVCDRIFVDDQGVITEGQVRQVYAAQALQAMGVTEVAGQPINTSDFWLSNAQLITVWPAAPGDKLVGEDIYFGEDPMTTLTPIQQQDIPDYYQF